jgi:hypothetical protein
MFGLAVLHYRAKIILIAEVLPRCRPQFHFTRYWVIRSHFKECKGWCGPWRCWLGHNPTNHLLHEAALNLGLIPIHRSRCQRNSKTP